jgi:hypothetical protein
LSLAEPTFLQTPPNAESTEFKRTIHIPSGALNYISRTHLQPIASGKLTSAAGLLLLLLN